MRDWLPENHLAWFVIDAVKDIDLSPFYARYRQDGWGRAAYDPAMMVAIVLYAYAKGVGAENSDVRTRAAFSAPTVLRRDPRCPPGRPARSAHSRNGYLRSREVARLLRR